MEEIKKQQNNSGDQGDQKQFLMLPLRDAVVFPQTILPLFVGRKASVEAIEAAIKNDLLVFATTQKEVEVDHPDHEDVYEVGCLVRVLEVLKMPDKTMKIVVEGIARAKVSSKNLESRLGAVFVEQLESHSVESHQHEVWCEALRNQFKAYEELSQTSFSDSFDLFKGVHDVGVMADMMIAQMNISVEQKQKVLESVDLLERAELVMMNLKREMEWMEVSKRVKKKLKHVSKKIRKTTSDAKNCGCYNRSLKVKTVMMPTNTVH